MRSLAEKPDARATAQQEKRDDWHNNRQDTCDEAFKRY